MSRNRSIVVSFDLDGTLISHEFSTAVWREAIPKLVARQRGMRVEEAKQWVYRQYDEVGDGNLAWYQLDYWFHRFGLSRHWKEILEAHRHLIRPYPEVHDVLRLLAQHHPLVILSNASRPFIQVEMEVGGLNGFFQRVISATSDLGRVKKSREFYEEVSSMLGVEPSQMVHVGDHWEFDYLAPRQAGLRAYFLDRSGKKKGREVVPDLRVFMDRIR
jgi:putative hydrolase of the HAD superfamily